MRTKAVAALLGPYLQHQGACRIFRCVQCGSTREQDAHYYGAGRADAHGFVAFPCDCGLDEAMAQLGQPPLPTRRP